MRTETILKAFERMNPNDNSSKVRRNPGQEGDGNPGRAGDGNSVLSFPHRSIRRSTAKK